MPQRRKSGLDSFLTSALNKDREFRRLFWKEAAKLPPRSRKKLERGLPA